MKNKNLGEDTFCVANLQVGVYMKTVELSFMWDRMGQNGKNSKYRRNEDTAYIWHLTFRIVDNPKVRLHSR